MNACILCNRIQIERKPCLSFRDVLLHFCASYCTFWRQCVNGALPGGEVCQFTWNCMSKQQPEQALWRECTSRRRLIVGGWMDGSVSLALNTNGFMLYILDASTNVFSHCTHLIGSKMKCTVNTVPHCRPLFNTDDPSVCMCGCGR